MSDTVSAPGGPGGGAPPSPMTALAGGPMAAGAGPPMGFPRPRPSVPGLGTQAGGLRKLQDVIKLMQMSLAEMPIGSELHKAILKALGDLSKHVPNAPETQGIQQTGIQDMMQQIVKNAMAQRVMANQGGPPAMPPATPLPGA